MCLSKVVISDANWVASAAPVCRTKRRCRFMPRRVGEVVSTHVKFVPLYLYLHRIRLGVERDPRPYSDAALPPIDSELRSTRLKRGC